MLCFSGGDRAKPNMQNGECYLPITYLNKIFVNENLFSKYSGNLEMFKVAISLFLNKKKIWCEKYFKNDTELKVHIQI